MKTGTRYHVTTSVAFLMTDQDLGVPSHEIHDRVWALIEMENTPDFFFLIENEIFEIRTFSGTLGYPQKLEADLVFSPKTEVYFRSSMEGIPTELLNLCLKQKIIVPLD